VRELVLVVAFLGCGRIAFDPLGDGTVTGDGAIGDGASDDTSSGDGNNVVVPAPLAWWKLDENTGTMAMDSAGTAHGTLTPGAALPAWTDPAKLGSGLTFAGDGDGVNLNAPAVLANVPMLSITAWVRPATIAMNVNQCIFDKARPGGGYFFNTSTFADGSIEFTVIAGGSNECKRASAANHVAANTWNHVAVTWTGSTLLNDAIHLYVNGAEVSYAQTTTGGTRQDDASLPANINCKAGSGLAATIDDVRFFDVVLTPAEVAALAAQ
jgi:hypothetical protein